MPIAGRQCGQALVRMICSDDGNDRGDSTQPVQFMPLIGAEGWPDNERSAIGQISAARNSAGTVP